MDKVIEVREYWQSFDTEKLESVKEVLIDNIIDVIERDDISALIRISNKIDDIHKELSSRREIK